MDDKKYYLAIINEGGNIYGHLSDISFHDDTNRFDPFNVLGDLLDLALDYEKVPLEDSMIWKHSFNETYQQHPFFQDEDIRRKIELYRHKTDHTPRAGDESAGLMIELNSFLIAVMRVHECFEHGNSISMTELELIKAFNQFKFTFAVGQRGINPYYRNGGIYYKDWEKAGKLYAIAEMGYDINSEFYYMPVFFGTHVTPESWQEYLENAENPIRFAYTCYSLEEVFFAVWHYLIFHDYTKFHQCPHCSRYFATKSLRGYCNRKSPYKGYGYLANAYKGYGDLNCKLAVDRMKEQLTKRKGKVCEYLQTHYGSSVRHKFEDEYVLLKDAVKNCPSIENIKKLDLFLAIDEVQNTWYKDEYKE